jgi:hypothetical protein
MPSVEGHQRTDGFLRSLLAGALIASLAASALWLTIGWADSAAGASTPVLGRPAATASAAPGHRDAHTAGHKQGTFAVAVSVFGIIVLILLIFLLGSQSVRRRMGGSTAIRRRGERGPPEPGRGLFG